MNTYYNEIEPFAVEWLENLILSGNAILPSLGAVFIVSAMEVIDV